MKIKFDDYKISLLTQLFSVSPDTVRLYEKKGLLKPQKSESNYRVFSRNDFFDMEYISRLKKMGFSLNDINEMLLKSSTEDIQNKLEERLVDIEEKECALKAEKQETENFLKYVFEIKDKSETIEIVENAVIAGCDIDDSIESSRKKLESFGLPDKPRLTAVIRNVLTDDIRKTDTRQELELIYTVTDTEKILDKKSELTTENTSGIFFLPKGDYIRIVTKADTGKKYPDTKRLEKFLAEKGISIVGCAYSRCIMSQRVQDVSQDYYETWIPIK